MTDYREIGKIVGIHGLQGEMCLKHPFMKKMGLPKVEVLLFEINKGSFIPFFLQKFTVKSHDEIIFKVEGVANREEAKKHLHISVWLLVDDYVRIVPKSAVATLLGYSIFNGGDYIGVVEEIYDNKDNKLLKATFSGKEVFLPYNKEMVEKVSHTEKTIVLKLPEGLLDVYLEENEPD